MKSEALLISFLLIIISCFTLGCGQETEVAQGITIEDDFGRQVVIHTVPEKIVSLTPSGTEILFALGLGPRVVGGTNFDNYPPEALDLPKVGDYENPNLESIIALEPDLVLADSIHQKAVEELERLGIPVLAFDPASVAGVYDTLIRIGTATGVLEAAEELVDQMQSEVADLTAPLASLAEEDKPTVYYEIWYEPLITVGPQTYIHDMITLAGGHNIAADAQTPWPEYSLEVLIEKDPQIIICPRILMGGITVEEEDFAGRPGWGNITAVREGRIYLVEDDLISRPGPRCVQGLKELVQILHPDLYPTN